MGHSLFHKLLFDDSDEDEIIRQVLKGSTSQHKRRRTIERDHLASHKDFISTTLPTHQYILLIYFRGDFG